MRKSAAIGVLAGCLFLLALPASAGALAPISSFSSFGGGMGQTNQPRGMAIDSEGFIYIADSLNHRIVVFSPQEEFVHAFGRDVNPMGGDVCTIATACRAGTAGSGAGALNRPVDVAVDSSGNVIVADLNNNRVDVFDADGAFIRAFGREVRVGGGGVCTSATGCRQGNEGEEGGAFDGPTGVDIDSAGMVYVANERNNRVDVFTIVGAFVRAFGRDVGESNADVCTAAEANECREGENGGEAGAIDEPQGLAIDANDRVSVIDSGNRRVDVFEANGAFQFAFGMAVAPGGDVCTAATGCRKATASTAAGGLVSPSGIAVDATGAIYVADALNNRVNEFDSKGAFLRAFGQGVVNGQPAFQVCTVASGCTAGTASTQTGSIPSPFGVAVDCEGAIYATEWISPDFSRVERFGEPETASCAPPEPEPEPESESPGPGGGSGSTPTPGSVLQTTPFVLPPSGSAAVAKPKFRIELNKWDGTATVIAVVSNPGTLMVRGKGVRKAKRVAKRLGEVELLVEGTDKLKRKLKKTGKAKVKLMLTFAPDKGPASTQAASVTLKFDPLF